MSDDLPAMLSSLTRDEMRDLAGRLMDIPASARLRKDLLVEYITQQASAKNIASVLVEAITRKLAAKTQARELKAIESRRRHAQAMQAKRAARRAQRTEESRREIGQFMSLPDDAQVKECYRQFYEATGASVLAHVVCAVCAREVFQTGTRQLPLSDLPNASRLKPADSHPAHTLYDGCLLEPRGVDGNLVRVCVECYMDLQHRSDLPPKYSLANGMWIGPVPNVLAELTVPEQLLIALVYPRVYVFKLFSKLRGYKPAEESLQRAMRGTVSTFEMDTRGVAAMVEGDLMPRKPSILASLISVTFIGSGKLPHNWLKNTFRVRRGKIAEALRWLHTNNPRYYGDIIISDERLNLLPEDDVPDAIEGIVRQSEDDSVLEREHGGYAPAEGRSLDEYDNTGNNGSDTAQPNVRSVTQERSPNSEVAQEVASNGTWQFIFLIPG